MPTKAYSSSLIWFLACLALCQVPACAAKQDLAFPQSPRLIARRVAAPATHTPKLKSLQPEEDYSVVPDPSELFDKAVKEYAAGNLPDAEKLFEEVLKVDPKSADAHFNLGAISEWRKDLRTALMHYKIAAFLKPKDEGIAEALRDVQFKIKNAPALAALAEREKQQHDLSMHGQLAKQAFSSQNYAEAINHLSYLVKAMPEDAKIQFALGQSFRALKYYEWAGYRLKLAIYLDPQNDLYRKALVELDNEIEQAQGDAYNQTAEDVLKSVKPLTFAELNDIGVRPHVF